VNDLPAAAGAAPEAPIRTLRRRRDGKVIAGVATGVADYFRLDPILVRIAFVAFAFLGGSGILLYLLGLFFVPLPNEESAAQRAFSDLSNWGKWAGVALIGIALLVLLDELVLFNFFGGEIVWGAVLIAAGVFLLTRYEKRGPDTSDSETSSGGQSARVETARTELTSTDLIDTAQVEVVAKPKRMRAPILGLFTFGIALLALGFASVLDNAGWIEMSADRYPALLLTVIGGGLLMGAWWGRSRGLIVLGILLVPITIVGGFIDAPLKGGVGERYWAPASIAATDSEYRLSLGQATLDLSDLELGTQTVEIEASVAVGQLVVIVPRRINLEIDGHVGAGQVSVPNGFDEGTNAVVHVIDSSATAAGTLVLNVEGGLGRVEVRRAYPFEEGV
jgi:phage shock protein PspC (stress-responsive transcriptional regulator)/predicted membrane protein